MEPRYQPDLPDDPYCRGTGIHPHDRAYEMMERYNKEVHEMSELCMATLTIAPRPTTLHGALEWLARAEANVEYLGKDWPKIDFSSLAFELRQVRSGLDALTLGAK